MIHVHLAYLISFFFEYRKKENHFQRIPLLNKYFIHLKNNQKAVLYEDVLTVFKF